VQLKGDTRNRRSLAAIERIGATFEGVLRKNRILPDGFVRDSAYYSVIREEWLSVKARLERMATGQV
jgi:RimJ/RimL family protein N-acetyltransferase